ncbi:DUF938 domain-containing protein [Novosphingobium colocasiae]|uniref:DUF938 domain-containing protein n=1 Tax=Novosphingobium colocasiae TaxID=1256513 RepID=UPI0035ADE8D6
MPADARLHYPATARNRDAILAVLRDELPGTGTVLEIASGSGEHALAFAVAMPHLIWQPSDPEAAARASISGWIAAEGTANLLLPLALDATDPHAWPHMLADAVLCINMIHISPWQATLGLMAGAARLLAPGAPLITYGPYRRDGIDLEPSNAAFDADLRRRDARWGLRTVEEVAQAALDQGLVLARTVAMPANNLSLVFRRR